MRSLRQLRNSTVAKKKPNSTLFGPIKIKKSKLRKGHQSRKNSAGPMADKRTKRLKTRATKNRIDKEE